jgi:membrane protease YdiL (CAAX protease family)
MWVSIRQLDLKIVYILVGVAAVEVLSYYLTSRRFFRLSLAQHFAGDPLVGLYEYLYWFIGDFCCQFALPVIFILTVLRRPLKEFGLGLGDYRLGWRVSFFFWLVLVPILWIVSAFDSFQLTYPHARTVRADWSLFVVYELCFVLYVIGWEFIWRGYMLFGLRQRFGGYAVFMQMIPFVLLHFGKPVLETLGAIIGGIALGFLALRTSSFWYGTLTHSLVLFSIDLLSTLRYRSQVFSMNPFSIPEILQKSF